MSRERESVNAPFTVIVSVNNRCAAFGYYWHSQRKVLTKEINMVCHKLLRKDLIFDPE